MEWIMIKGIIEIYQQFMRFNLDFTKKNIIDNLYKKVPQNITKYTTKPLGKAAKKAMLFSRTNTLLSLPMLLSMVAAQNLY